MHLVSSIKTLDGALETWFIQNIILAGDPFVIKRPNLLLINKIIIYLELFQIDEKFLSLMKNHNNKLILIHMGDEFGNKDNTLYPSFDLVLRNYFFSDIFTRPDLSNKLLWIPNGFRTGVGPRHPVNLLPATQRIHLASFMGWIQNPDSFQGERDSFARMIKTIRDRKDQRFRVFKQWLYKCLNPNLERQSFSQIALENKDLYLLSSSGFGRGNQVGLYSAILENSIFAPCPAGNSPETIRLYDALECGCIPISLHHKFIHSPLALSRFGPAPFPLLSSWDQLPNFLTEQKRRLRENPDAILTLQKNCIEWWSRYKKEISALVHSRITALKTSFQ